MESITERVFEYLEKHVLPLGFINLARGIKVSEEEMSTSKKVASTLQPGDLIFTREPNLLYKLGRKVTASQYDHVVVVVDQEKCLHICYPKTKLAPTYQFTLQKKEPLVFRPKNVDPEKMSFFIQDLVQSSINKRYDTHRVAHFLRISLFYQVKESAAAFCDNLKKVSLAKFSQTGIQENTIPEIRIDAAQTAPKSLPQENSGRLICSHQIFQSLAKVMPQISEAVAKNEFGDLYDLDQSKQTGFFTPEDAFRVYQSLQQNADCFTMLQLYDKPVLSPLEQSVFQVLQKKISLLKTESSKYKNEIRFQLIVIEQLLRLSRIVSWTTQQMFALCYDKKTHATSFDALKKLEQVISALLFVINSDEEAFSNGRLVLPMLRLVLLVVGGSSVKTPLAVAAFILKLSRKVSKFTNPESKL